MRIGHGRQIHRAILCPEAAGNGASPGHKTEWCGPLGKLVGGVEFRRGILEHVSAKTAVFLEHAEQIFQMPTVRSAKLNTLKPVLDEFVRCSHLSRLTQLSLNTCQMGAARAKTLFSCPYLENLTWLDLGNNGLGPRGLEALMGARWPRLQWLGLVRNRLGPRGAELLANWPLLEQLSGLEIDDNDFGDASAAFEESPSLRRRAERIASSIQSGNLRELNLKFCPEIDEHVACLLADSPALEHVRMLSLSDVGDRACAALAASVHACPLRELHLKSCRDITGSGIRAILSSPN